MVSNYVYEGSRVMVEGTIAGSDFVLNHERLETVNRLTIESGETRFTFERGADGENVYTVEQPDLGKHTVRGEELDGTQREAHLGVLKEMRSNPEESAPRRDLEERGLGLWLAMMPELIEQLENMGLAASEISSMAETTTGTYMMLMARESATLWAGGVIGGCSVSHQGTTCSCPSVSCFAGSTPTGVGPCTIFARCTKINGGVDIGPVGELNGEYSDCTTFGNCTCGATCQQCNQTEPGDAGVEPGDAGTTPGDSGGSGPAEPAPNPRGG